MVDFADGALQQIAPLEIPTFQPMQLIKGDLQQIEAQLQQFADYHGELPVLVLDIEVATQDYLSDIQRRIQQLAEDLPVEVVLLRRSKEQRNQTLAQQDKETLNELSVGRSLRAPVGVGSRDGRTAPTADAADVPAGGRNLASPRGAIRMKILSLRLKNLNSLQGEWKNRLHGGTFASNGLFAITGPPARVKPPCWMPSVWLLYHQTPRLGSQRQPERIG
ncbi:Nuclease sbcCD subunit D [Serratia fonticola]|uniref:Nuclease sbcCD subunit D n=1 Tax=Serratia fonticola TaxID=47917 RepID=A0A4U9UXX2_SERFO|nr:Nuclease sbcCD subunit D [Serratia fonticola]